MVQIGVWEREEGVAGAVEAALAAAGRAGLRLLNGAHPAALAGEALSLLTVSPSPAARCCCPAPPDPWPGI